MATEERIQQLLDCANSIPMKDVAGIIIPAGVDSAIRAKAIKECLQIVQDEKAKENLNN